MASLGDAELIMSYDLGYLFFFVFFFLSERLLGTYFDSYEMCSLREEFYSCYFICYDVPYDGLSK